MDRIRVLPLLTKGEVHYSKKRKTDVDTMREMEIIAETIRRTNKAYHVGSRYAKDYKSEDYKGIFIGFERVGKSVGDIMDLRNDLVRDYDFVESIDWFSEGETDKGTSIYSFMIKFTKNHTLTAYEFLLFHWYVELKLTKMKNTVKIYNS